MFFDYFLPVKCTPTLIKVCSFIFHRYFELEIFNFVIVLPVLVFRIMWDIWIYEEYYITPSLGRRNVILRICWALAPHGSTLMLIVHPLPQTGMSAGHDWSQSYLQLVSKYGWPGTTQFGDKWPMGFGMFKQMKNMLFKYVKNEGVVSCMWSRLKFQNFEIGRDSFTKREKDSYSSFRPGRKNIFVCLEICQISLYVRNYINNKSLKAI
jgi:hypothetical protein